MTEDTRNPVIGRLIEKYNAKLLITDLPRAIGYILSAKNLVLSFGTFVPMLLRLTPEDPEKRIFRYSTDLSHFSDIWREFYFTDASERYFEGLLNKNWNNTAEQREMMLNETCGDEWKVFTYGEYPYVHKKRKSMGKRKKSKK